MNIIGRSHEVLIRRLDKDNPESDYYEVYPVSTADNIFMTSDEDESLSEFLYGMRFKYNIFIENLDFPVLSVQVFNGKEFGPVKLGRVYLTAKDFGLDRVDNTSDAEKPVNSYHQTFIESYISTISAQINRILENLDSWNAHITDLNNPHHVTWEQVTNNSPVNPNELVDEQFVDDAIKAHNESTDLTTLHPEIMRQINNIKSQVDALNAIITALENSLRQVATDTATDLIANHNEDPGAHPFLVAKLEQLGKDIDDAIAKYSGLSGVELVSNKVEEIPINQAEIEPGTYPTVKAIANFANTLNLKSYQDVRHVQNVTEDELYALIKSGRSGIIFSDAYNGTPGTTVVVYANGEQEARYNFPAAAPTFYIEHVVSPPSQSALKKKYGNNSALILCDRSSTDASKQAIVMWAQNQYHEFVIDTIKLAPGEKLYQADYSYRNDEYDFASKFPGGQGILFVQDLNNTERPGVVIYDKSANPTTKELVYGGKNPANVLLKEVATPPSADTVKAMFPPNGTGLVYVDDVSNGVYGIPSLEYWVEGVRQLNKPIPKIVHERHEITIAGNGSAQSVGIRFINDYIVPPKAIVILGGIDTTGTTAQSITATGYIPSITKTDCTASFTVTNGMYASFAVDVVGMLDVTNIGDIIITPQPTRWKFMQIITTSTTFVMRPGKWYKVHVFGKSGDGGNATATSNGQACGGAGGGGAGGYACSILKANTITNVSCIISTTVTRFGNYLSATSGENGGTATTSSSSSNGAPGGRGGVGSGGNVSNLTGAAGGAGNKTITHSADAGDVIDNPGERGGNSGGNGGRGYFTGGYGTWYVGGGGGGGARLPAPIYVGGMGAIGKGGDGSMTYSAVSGTGLTRHGQNGANSNMVMSNGLPVLYGGGGGAGGIRKSQYTNVGETFGGKGSPAVIIIEEGA